MSDSPEYRPPFAFGTVPSLPLTKPEVEPVAPAGVGAVAPPIPAPQAAVYPGLVPGPAPVAAPVAAPVSAPVAAPGLAPAPTPVAAPAVPGLASQGQYAQSPAMPVVAPPASTPGVQEMTEEDLRERRIMLDDLLEHLLEHGGSDLHLSAGSVPAVRIRGEIEPIPDYDALTANQIQEAMYAILTTKQRAKFEEHLELDFAYTLPGQARFRVNLMRQRGAVGAVLRVIPWEIKSLESLNLPPILGEFAAYPRGLVLVTGPTGSGKSTTLAAIIDKANRTRRGHIITIEDPIEFIHPNRESVVNQREVGEDTHSFAAALKHVLRQDPDIILVGELRDLETISVALTAAETGHLVFATLHTQSAAETITRVIDVFPSAQQEQVRTQLAAGLQAIVCQTLCKTADGNGRAAAVEIMICNTGIRALIKDNKLQQIPGFLQAGSKHGMQTLNQHLAQLVREGKITLETAYEKCSQRDELETLLSGPSNMPRGTLAQHVAATRPVTR